MRKKAKYLADVPDAVAMSEESLKYDPRYKEKKSKGKGSKVKAKEETTPAVETPPVQTHAQEPASEPSSFPYQLHGLDSKLNTTVLPESSSPYEFLQPNVNSQAGTRDISHAIGQATQIGPELQSSGHMGSTGLVEMNSRNPSQLGYNSSNSGRSAETNGLRPSRHNFQSMAVNMEYSIISNILTSSNQYNTIGHGDMTTSSLSPSLNSTNGEESPGPQKLDLHHQAVHQHHSLHANPLNQFSLGSASTEQAPNFSQVLETVEQLNKQQHHSHEWYEPATPKRPLSFTISNADDHDVSVVGRNGSTSSTSSSGTGYPWQYREPADIYANVRQPFSYTPAYHQLTIYIRTRFKRDQQMHIAKCMASYRPSFIACTNTLKEDDLIFMEQCFQRTLLEYEKFISYSGTPTLVWRRTGQVAAVGKEFCILTGWPRERLLNEHTFVVELMDDSSVLEYFEMFSKMAFGDSRGANMSECTLLTPQGQKIKTSSIWTLKRDVFGIPMMIVGNFLPILP